MSFRVHTVTSIPKSAMMHLGECRKAESMAKTLTGDEPSCRVHKQKPHGPLSFFVIWASSFAGSQRSAAGWVQDKLLPCLVLLRVDSSVDATSPELPMEDTEGAVKGVPPISDTRTAFSLAILAGTIWAVRMTYSAVLGVRFAVAGSKVHDKHLGGWQSDSHLALDHDHQPLGLLSGEGAENLTWAEMGMPEKE